MTTRHYVSGEREQQNNYTKFVCVPPATPVGKGSSITATVSENEPQEASCDSTLRSI